MSQAESFILPVESITNERSTGISNLNSLHQTYNTIDQTIEILEPEIKIIVQPVSSFRFRYETEVKGTHGKLLGDNGGNILGKETPTVQLINFSGKNAFIRCMLVSTDENRYYHPHRLVLKDKKSNDYPYQDDPLDIKVSEENNYTAKFSNISIICTPKKDIMQEIMRKRKIEFLEEKKRSNPTSSNTDAEEDLKLEKEIRKNKKLIPKNLNSVALCFEGFHCDENGIMQSITKKVYSHPINNQKSAETKDLKICHIDKEKSSCEGDEEIWLLVEKVPKKNIKIKFYELDDSGNLVWEAEGKFEEKDVHYQYAIIFKTPPYGNINITEEKKVFLRLERPSDGKVSNSIEFSYVPSQKNLTRKRPYLSISPDFSDHQIDTENQKYESSNGIKMNKYIPNSLDETLELLNDSSLSDLDFSLFSELDALNSLSGLDEGLQIDGERIEDSRNSQIESVKNILKRIIDDTKEMRNSRADLQKSIMNVYDLLQETISSGDTILHFFLRNSQQYKMAQSILHLINIHSSFKRIINFQNVSGETPLHIAVAENHPEIVKKLLNLGANPNLCDKEGYTPLHSAVILKSNNCLDELIKSRQLNEEIQTFTGFTALHLAAKVGSLYGIKALINIGANVNSVDSSLGRTVLHVAVDSNRKEIVEYLLAKTNINVLAKDSENNTALQNALMKSNMELVKLFERYETNCYIKHENNEEEIHTENNLEKLSNLERIQQNIKEKLYVTEDYKGQILMNDNIKSNDKIEIPMKKHEESTNDEDLTFNHMARITDILNRNSKWIQLANCTNNQDLINLLKKMSNPSLTLLFRMQLHDPSITVLELKKILIEAGLQEAAMALD